MTADEVLFDESNYETLAEAHQLSDGMLLLVKSMKMHEKAKFEIKKDYFNREFRFPEVNQDVKIEIEVLEMRKAEDINHDMTFYKRIITHGPGKDIPNSNAHIQIHYRLEIEGSVVFGDYDREPLDFVMDDE